MLEIKNLNLSFNIGLEDKKIFSNLNLHVRPEEFVIVIGGNGTGKSTLMNLISGSIFPDSGQIFIDKKDVTYCPEYKRAKYIGHLFQLPLKGTAPNMTIEENLSLAMLRNKKRTLKLCVNKNNREFFREKLLELDLNLEDRLTTKIGVLSGGQRQAVTLLMATFSEPKILILDEHTAALDPSTSEKILELTNKIVEEKKITTIMITHNLEDALRFGTRIIMLTNNNIVLDLSGEEKQNLNMEYLYKLFHS
ncbi:MAG: ABC transporter ATP-binding protein [Candidatus Improbicoccus pseudotrichonymphae]|uniref:ABC transporter ATP-binding protein n=1 Tax=Candidatus Improbicoccus pseudotrichonymphae TaxID=3033792 RepID=A0AA48I538_9FIRM|nr:MAG: ABC transporter ATP-binding protein [Candidatus Improbicoccus pseudotrichonymphae]